MAELLHLENPYRKTAITEVAAVHGQGIVLPRSIYYARSTRYAHPQPTDRGHFMVEGHKLKVRKVAWRRGDLVHFVTGPPPKVGARVLCHLEWPRRYLAMRAHGALHLVAHAVEGERRGHVDDLEVKGGGTVRARVRLKDASKHGVSDVLQRVNAWVAEDHAVQHGWFARDAAAARATPSGTPVPDVAPGEPSLRMVDVGDFSRVPCDAPVVQRTHEVGRVVAPRVTFGAQGRVDVQFRVQEAS